MNEFQADKLKKVRSRPNNYCLVIHILPDSPEFHISESKITGRNTSTETVENGDITIIKYSNKTIIIYLKKKFAKSVLYSEEFRKFHDNIRKFLAGKLYGFMQQYPETKLDWTNSILHPRDQGMKDPDVNIESSLTWDKPIHKKVYFNKEFEIKDNQQKHFSSVDGVCNYLDNRLLENKLPKVESIINRFSDQVQLHLDVERRNADLIEKQNDVLDAIKQNLKKESFFGMIKQRVFGR